jgi:hypothetical protein
MAKCGDTIIYHSGQHLFRHKHDKLKHLEWSKAGHILDVDILPQASGVYDLGSPDLHFDTLYVNNIVGLDVTGPSGPTGPTGDTGIGETGPSGPGAFTVTEAIPSGDDVTGRTIFVKAGSHPYIYGC